MRDLLLKFDNKAGIQALFFYCIVGGLSAAISFSSFALLWDICHINYKIAVTISYVLAILFNFTCNRHFTFKSLGRGLFRQIYRYLTMILLNYVITLFTVHASVQWLSLSPYFGLLASIAVTAIVGFILSKFWVYTVRESA